MLSIPFDNPMTYAGHSGVDFPQPQGTPFRASADGVVTWLGHNAAGGYFIWVKYDGVGPKVGYHHMPSHAGCPREGARFKAGDRLGYVGTTGRSTGPHLHSEVEEHRTTAGYWKFFDRNRVVGGGNFAGQGDDDMPLSSEDVKRVAAETVRQMSAATLGQRIKVIYDSIRFGKKGVRTHGELTGKIMSEIGAQKIFRAHNGGDAEVDVKALAAELAPLLNEQEADELVKALLAAQGKALTDAAE